MTIEGLHTYEIAAIIRAANRFGGIDKIRPCGTCGETFNRKSIQRYDIVKKSFLWYEDTINHSAHVEEVIYEQ